jgi:hypothetical protein
MTDTGPAAWPSDSAARKEGDSRQVCGFVRIEDPAGGVRIFTGQVADAYVVPGREDDPNPGRPLPWAYLNDGHQPSGPFHALADDVRRLLPAGTP